MEIKIKIDAAGLEGAIHTLAQVLAGMDLPQTQQSQIQPNLTVGDSTKTAEKETKEAPIKEDTPGPAKEEPKEEKASTGLTFEQVRVKLAAVSQKGKQKELHALIAEFDPSDKPKLSNVPEDKFAELLEKAADL